MPDIESNKQLVQAYVAAFNQGDLEALRNLFTPNAEIQGVLGVGHLDKALGVWSQLISGLGINLTIEEMIGEGETVAVRMTERGIFQGEFLGHAPTGKSYELVVMEWFSIRDGKIFRRWGARDAASQARQIDLPLQSVTNVQHTEK